MSIARFVAGLVLAGCGNHETSGSSGSGGALPPPRTIDAAAVVHAAPEFPVVDCATLLTLDEVAAQCHVAKSTLKITVEPEGRVSPALDRRTSPTKDLCSRVITRQNSETWFQLYVIGYPAAADAELIRSLDPQAPKSDTIQVQESPAFLRRELRAYGGRFQYNMYITDQKDPKKRFDKFCSDEALLVMWKQFEQRVLAMH